MVPSSISRGGPDWPGWGWGGQGLRVAVSTQRKLLCEFTAATDSLDLRAWH